MSCPFPPADGEWENCVGGRRHYPLTAKPSLTGDSSPHIPSIGPAPRNDRELFADLITSADSIKRAGYY